MVIVITSCGSLPLSGPDAVTAPLRKALYVAYRREVKHMDDDFELIMSPLCQAVERDGRSVQVEIYGDGDGGWILEVVDEFNSSLVWDDSFPTDQAALDEVMRQIEAEGISSLIGPSPESGH
jgi:hypothetical protein